MFEKTVMHLTDNAAKQVRTLLAQSKSKSFKGIRVGVRSGGCSGFKYFIEYADKKNPFDEVVQDKGVVVFIDPKALMYLIGTQMDFISEQFKSGFVFKNPNEKGKCGCGSSFNV